MVAVDAYRQLTSMRRAPWLVYLDSTWNTPHVNPSASVAATDSWMSSSCCCRVSTDGQLAPTSWKYGSIVGQLSVTSAYTARPSDSTMSTSTSGPSRYCSIIITTSKALELAPVSPLSGAYTSAPLVTTARPMSATTFV